MISSGTLARGWSSTRKRTAAATSSGWRIASRRSCADGDGPGVEDRRVDLAGVDHRRADAVRPFLAAEADARAPPGRTSRPSSPRRPARWPACPRSSRSGRPGRFRAPASTGRTAWTRLNAPVRLVAIILSQSAGSRASPGSGSGRWSPRCRPGRRSPRTPRGPARPSPRPRPGRRRRRRTTSAAPGPTRESSARVSSSLARSRPTRATRSPIPIQATAIPRPIPLPAPVISAV